MNFFRNNLHDYIDLNVNGYDFCLFVTLDNDEEFSGEGYALDTQEGGDQVALIEYNDALSVAVRVYQLAKAFTLAEQEKAMENNQAALREITDTLTQCGYYATCENADGEIVSGLMEIPFDLIATPTGYHLTYDGVEVAEIVAGDTMRIVGKIIAGITHAEIVAGVR